MKINLYSVFDMTHGFSFPASKQMELAGAAMERMGHRVYYRDIFGERFEGDMNIMFPFHYWKSANFQRIQDSVGGWHTPKMKPYTNNDIPVGFADSSVFDAASLEDIQKYNYRFFAAMSHDTAKVMNLPRTKIVGGTYDPQILDYEPRLPFDSKGAPVVYINGINFPVRRGLDLAVNACSALLNEGEDFHVLIRSWNPFKITEDAAERIHQLANIQPPEEHYGAIAASDIMLAPIRGGAYELQILEAMALGKTVVLTDKGGWTDIPLSRDDVYWTKAGKRDISMYAEYTPRAYHAGGMFHGNQESVTEALRQALKHPKKFDVDRYRQVYSPESYAQLYLDNFEKP